MKLSELLINYINIKNDINNLNNKMKEKKYKLNEYKNTILEYMNTKNLNNINFDEHKSKFILKNNKTYSSISQKYLKDIINKFYEKNKNNNDPDELIKFILNNREETFNKDLSLLPI